jgi:hypothetical protein
VTTAAATLLPGDFGLVRTHGEVSRLIGAAEFLDELAQGHWSTADRASLFRHAFLVERVDGQVVHAIEARPSGAGRATYRLDDPTIAWSAGHFQLTEAQRQAIVAWAVAHIGDTYSWRAYVRQAAVRLHLPLAAALMARQIEENHEELCSQFVDCAYQAGPYQLFADGRAPYDVAPSDLADLIAA